MITPAIRPLLFVALLFLIVPSLHAQDLDRHRDMRLGTNVLAVATAHGLSSADAKTVHERPALVQTLEWRSKRFLSAAVPADDPVNDITFRFYNDQLFSIVASYDPKRTEGLTDADLIEAMSPAYGSPQPPPPATTAKSSPRSQRSENGADSQVIARWENAESAVTLVRRRYPAEVSLVVVSKRLTALAQSAELEAARLDRAEAPGREAARVQQEADAARQSAEKARPANKAIFKP
jgi:hypothetical protein